jgi:hypothetical protein
MQLAGEGRAEELRSLLRRKCFEPSGGLYYFTKVVMGYKDLVLNFHLELCDKLQKPPKNKHGYLEPRGHFKSTCIKAYMLWRLAGGNSLFLSDILRLGDVIDKHNQAVELLAYYRAYPERDPRNLRFLLIGESDTVAQKDLRDPKWHLENNDMLRWLFPEIIPSNTNETKWTDSEITIPRTKSFDESTITCDGVGAKRTGFHWDVLIYEDIFGEKASKSEPLAFEVQSWFQSAAGMLNHPEESEELMIGTHWKAGESDIYGWIKVNMPGKFVWTERSVYNDDGSIAFYQRFTESVLADILERQGPYLFSCNYLNSPIPPTGGDFNSADLRYFKVDFEKQEIVPTDGSPRVKLKDLVRNSFYDPSSGGQSAKCENAITAVGGDFTKRIFVLECIGKNCSMGQMVEEWHQLNDKMRFNHNRYESVGAQKEVGDIINTRDLWPECLICKKQGREGVKHLKLRAEGVTPPGGKISKDDRIRLYLTHPIEEHRLYLRLDRPQLKTQIVSFPHYHLKDQVDATAYAVFECQFPLSPGEIEARQHDEEILKSKQVPFTSTRHEYGGYV